MSILSDFLRYVVVGGIAFSFDFALLIFLTELVGLHYLFSAPIAFLAGLLVNYFLSIHWVFKKRRYANEKKEFSIFAIIGIIGILLTELTLAILTPVFGIYKIAKIIACIIVLFWNFFMRRYFLFREKRQDSHPS